MSHYEERLQADLDRLRAHVGELSTLVDANIMAAVRALLALDRSAAAHAILADQRINRRVREGDRLCHAFVARHLPSAGILRTISAVLRLNVALERIGDYAVTIAREAVQLTAIPPPAVLRDIELMAEQSQEMFGQSMQAFFEHNAELARGTRGMARQIDHTMDRVFDGLAEEGERQKLSVRDLFGVLIVFNRLERISDQAKNICEEIVFAETGELPGPKQPRILFMDRANDSWSLLAEALARKTYPDLGRYESAGTEAAVQANPVLQAFLESKGLDQGVLAPAPIPKTHDALDDYDLIIGVGTVPREHLTELPFRTVFLAWDVVPAQAEHGAELTPDMLDAVAKELAERLHDLMSMIHGEQAD